MILWLAGNPFILILKLQSLLTSEDAQVCTTTQVQHNQTWLARQNLKTQSEAGITMVAPLLTQAFCFRFVASFCSELELLHSIDSPLLNVAVSSPPVEAPVSSIGPLQ